MSGDDEEVTFKGDLHGPGGIVGLGANRRLVNGEPIHTLDVPIDDSGADEAVERLKANGAPKVINLTLVLGKDGLSPSRDTYDPVKQATALKALGFAVMPLPTKRKFPPQKDWVAASKNNPAVFLKNPGTNNYAVLPPPGCFGWDVDEGVPDLLKGMTKTLGVFLPETTLTKTPNGLHLVYRWPDGVARPKGNRMFGQVVTRWPLGDETQGYLVGPGSVVEQDDGSLGTYYGTDPVVAVADLPLEWARAALAFKAKPSVAPAGSGEPLAEVRAGYELPDTVGTGGRYGAILAYTAHLYNRGLSPGEMWALVWVELAPRFAESLSIKDLRERFERATEGMGGRLGEPKAQERGWAWGQQDQPERGSLFVPTVEFIRTARSVATPRSVVEDMFSYNGLNFVGGGPKSGKSLFILYTGFSVAAGLPVLGKAVTRMPFVYLTEEGTAQDTADRLARLGVSLGRADTFTVHRQRRHLDDAYCDALIGEVAQWFGNDPVLLALDPLRNYLPDGVSENDQGAVQRVIRRLYDMKAALPNLTLLVCHHARKRKPGGGGRLDGEELSGSGTIYASADSTVMWEPKKTFHDTEDDGTLVDIRDLSGKASVEHKSGAAWRFGWAYEPLSGTFSLGEGKDATVAGLTPGEAEVVRAMDALDARDGEVKERSASEIATAIGKAPETVRTMLKRIVGKPEGGLYSAGSLFVRSAIRASAGPDKRPDKGFFGASESDPDSEARQNQTEGPE